MYDREQYWDGPTDSQEDDLAPVMRRRKVQPMNVEHGASREEGAPAPDEAPQESRLRHTNPEDTEAAIKALEEAGFSRSQAERLIFERRRPRGEGVARS